MTYNFAKGYRAESLGTASQSSSEARPSRRSEADRAKAAALRAEIAAMSYYPNGVTYCTEEERAAAYRRVRLAKQLSVDDL